MIVFDFIYFSIYSFVPDKAIFGKRDVACTLFSSCSSFFILGLCALFEYYFGYSPNNSKRYVMILVIIIFGSLFFLIRIIYLNPKKIKKINEKFKKIPIWALKLIGIFYVFFCFIFFAFILTILSLLKDNTL